jgi:hypothetical protein
MGLTLLEWFVVHFIVPLASIVICALVFLEPWFLWDC